MISLKQPFKVDMALVTVTLNECGYDVQYCLTTCTVLFDNMYVHCYSARSTKLVNCVYVFDLLTRSRNGWDRGSEKSLILQRGGLGVTAIKRIYRPIKFVISPHQRTVLWHPIFDLQLLLLNKMCSMPSCIMTILLQFMPHCVCTLY